MTAATMTSRLSRWPDHRLERLLVLRPDLCQPPVPDFAALAARASTQMSVLRALDGLDRAHLDVLEALAVARQLPDAGPGAITVRLAAFLDGPATTDGATATHGGRTPAATTITPAGTPTAALTGLLEDLADAALVEHGDDGWHLPLAVATALGPHPLGLGRSVAALRPAETTGIPAAGLALDGLPTSGLPTDRAGILAVLEREAPDPELLGRAHTALDALQSSPVTRLPDPPGPVHDLLLRTGLLLPAGALPDGTALAEHPLEAGLAWRDGTAGRSVHPEPPAPTGRTVPTGLSTNAALAAVTDLLRPTSDLLATLAEGLPTLRSGGVGVRELKRLAAASGSSPQDTAWLLELLAAAGLLVLDPDTSRWVPAAEASAWRRSDRHLQWETLVLGWLRSGRAPMLGPVPATGAQPTPGTPPTAHGGRALAPDRSRPDAPRLRAAVLETALEVSEERPGVQLDDAVPHRLRWHHPRRSVRTAGFTAPLLAEAARLGLTGAGALTPAGGLVAAGRVDEAADAVGTALPVPLTRVRLQGDLTAVAPGYLDPEVAGWLAVMADAEGAGAARVYRFSDASLHRALDAGMSPAALEEFLREHSEDALPQSLQYLIRDVARRHGALAVGTAGAWLRSEEADRLDAIVADPALAPARLERLAPTVAVAGVGPEELHRMLAAAGHRAAHVRADGPQGTGAEDHDGGPAGSVVDLGLRTSTAGSAFPAPVRAVRRVPGQEELAAQIARLRSAPRPAPTGPGTEEAVAVLRQATRQRAEVDLVTVDQRGTRQSRRVVPLAVAGGRLRCLDPDRESETVVPLHRIVSATSSE